MWLVLACVKNNNKHVSWQQSDATDETCRTTKRLCVIIQSNAIKITRPGRSHGTNGWRPRVQTAASCSHEESHLPPLKVLRQQKLLRAWQDEQSVSLPSETVHGFEIHTHSEICIHMLATVIQYWNSLTSKCFFLVKKTIRRIINSQPFQDTQMS